MWVILCNLLIYSAKLLGPKWIIYWQIESVSFKLRVYITLWHIDSSKYTQLTMKNKKERERKKSCQVYPSRSFLCHWINNRLCFFFLLFNEGFFFIGKFIKVSNAKLIDKESNNLHLILCEQKFAIQNKMNILIKSNLHRNLRFLCTIKWKINNKLIAINIFTLIS